MSKVAAKEVPFKEISQEAKTIYENMESLGFAYAIKTDFEKIDTVPVFEVKWRKGLMLSQSSEDQKKLHNWLKVRLKDTTLQLKEMVTN